MIRIPNPEAGPGLRGQSLFQPIAAAVKWQNREEIEESMRKAKEAGTRPYLSDFSPIPGIALRAVAKKASPCPKIGRAHV
jgi:DNA repair photolyase